MKSKYTILNKKELDLLEALVMRNGKIVTFEQIHDAIDNQNSREITRKRVADMCKAGWLIRLKKGLYLVVTDISTLGFSDVSDIVIAQSLIPESYISFESALQHHNLFDQMLSRIESVTKEKTRTYKINERDYSFYSIKEELFFGFTQETMNNFSVNIACGEKAILDMIYFRTSVYNINFILDLMNEYQNEIDFKKLQEYSVKYSLGMIRKVGFLLDHIGIDTSELYANKQIRKNTFTRLTPTSTQFNAKWRLYYDPQFNQ